MFVYAVIKSNGKSYTDGRSDSIDNLFDSMEKAREYVEQNMLKPRDFGDNWCYYETPYNEINIIRYKVY